MLLATVVAFLVARGRGGAWGGGAGAGKRQFPIEFDSIDYIIYSVTYDFRWNDWNVDHIGRHGVQPGEAEDVVQHPARGFPRFEGARKYRVWGRTAYGQNLQVVYVFSPPGVVYVLHARDLTEAEKRRLRRQER